MKGIIALTFGKCANMKSAICKLACGYLSLNVLIETAGDGQPFQQSGPRQNG